MALEDIDQLSDENGPASPQDKKTDLVTPDAKTEKPLKATPKAPTKKPKAAAEKSAPKSGGRKPALKRPAAAISAGTVSSEPVMKRPAGKQKYPDFISVCKSMYKANGVWSVKLGKKEVIRATGLHWIDLNTDGGILSKVILKVKKSVSVMFTLCVPGLIIPWLLRWSQCLVFQVMNWKELPCLGLIFMHYSLHMFLLNSCMDSLMSQPIESFRKLWSKSSDEQKEMWLQARSCMNIGCA